MFPLLRPLATSLFYVSSSSLHAPFCPSTSSREIQNVIGVRIDNLELL